MKTKAGLRINVMRKLKFQLDRKSLQIIYLSFIRPIFEYGDIIWNNQCAQYEANELEKIQYEAARIVSGATKLISINVLLKETGREPLSSRRKKHKLVLFYKMVNGLCPDYLHSLDPLQSETRQDIILEILKICKLYLQKRNFTVTLSCPL